MQFWVRMNKETNAKESVVVFLKALYREKFPSHPKLKEWGTFGNSTENTGVEGREKSRQWRNKALFPAL